MRRRDFQCGFSALGLSGCKKLSLPSKNFQSVKNFCYSSDILPSALIVSSIFVVDFFQITRSLFVFSRDLINSQPIDTADIIINDCMFLFKNMNVLVCIFLKQLWENFKKKAIFN